MKKDVTHITYVVEVQKKTTPQFFENDSFIHFRDTPRYSLHWVFHKNYGYAIDYLTHQLSYRIKNYQKKNEVIICLTVLPLGQAQLIAT